MMEWAMWEDGRWPPMDSDGEGEMHTLSPIPTKLAVQNHKMGRKGRREGKGRRRGRIFGLVRNLKPANNQLPAHIEGK
jgi:hypothetical protein